MSAGYDLVLQFDGLTEPVNPGGYGAWGFVLYVGSKTKFNGFGCLGKHTWMTNNYSEYCALGFGLKKIIDLQLEGIKSLTILGDSQLVINQLNEDWKMKSESLQPLRDKCLQYLEQIGVDWVARWIPRDINKDADEMSRQGYKSETGKEPVDRHKE
jgi:ribonuclease HI